MLTSLQIIIKKGAARGVKFIKDEKRFKVFARKEVILSAGAIGSPEILLRSGIGPKDDLRKLKVRKINKMEFL